MIRRQEGQRRAPAARRRLPGRRCGYSLLVLLAAAIVAASAQAQTMPAEAGRLPIHTFSPRDYGADPYVWYAAQGNGGLMYFANLDGVLEFDGRTWRTIPAGGTVIRSVAADNDGTIYVGSHNDLGVLRPDSVGRLRFVSLRGTIPDDVHEFGDVWQLLAVQDGVYFNTPTHIFRWRRGEEMRVWQGSFHKAFAVRDSVYVVDWDRGLVRLEESGAVTVPGGERFVDEALTAMLPYDEQRILLATAEGDLLLYDGTRFSRFRTDADEYLRIHRPWYYAFARLLDGSFALGTRDGGVIVLDRDGRIVQIADRTSGLRSDRIYYIHVDHQNGLWLTHEDGISRWEPRTPFSYFDESSGLRGNVEAMLRHDGRLYAATSSGVFRLHVSESPGRPAEFERVGNESQQCWDLAVVGGELLAACTNGVFNVAANRLHRAVPTETAAFSLHASARQRSTAYVGLKDGLARLPPGASTLERVDGVRMEVRSIAETADGRLWIGGAGGALLIDGRDGSDAVIGRFGWDNGPAAGYVRVSRVGDDVIVTASNGLWCAPNGAMPALPVSDDTAANVDESGRPSCTARIPRIGDRSIRDVVEGPGGDVWLRTSKEPVVVGGDGRTPLSMLDGWDTAAIYPDPEGAVWFGGSDGIARYDPALSNERSEPFSAFIRRFATIRTDSLLFGGAASPDAQHVVLPYTENSVRFSIGAATFDRRSEGLADRHFQYRLEGFDEDWSRWTGEIHKDYTNLPEGDYTFRVRARGADGGVSRTAAFAFSILPPWYRTVWAYALYGLLGLALVFGSARWRMARLERINLELEKQVAERSARLARQKEEMERANDLLADHQRELRAQNATLEDQKERLQELDAVKSRFFANISHEFRTPLTLILGPLEDALERPDVPLSDTIGEQVEPMHRNGVRLLGLINQLLDLARLDSGKMMLRARRVDLAVSLRTTAAAFSSRAARQQVELHVDAPPGPILVYADVEKLERVFVNLISNAFKFTPSGGTIRVSCSRTPSNAVVVVADTGGGIPSDRLGQIFDRFFTDDGEASVPHEGIGIGLALAREIVERHGGAIDAESEVGSGSRFTIRLPLGRAHLDDGDVVPPEETEQEGDPAQRAILRAPSEPEDGGRPDVSPEVEQADASRKAELEGSASPENGRYAAPPTEAADSRPCVLVVEDNPDLRAYLHNQLASGYRVEETADGRAGLERAREMHPDLVISDVMMPEVDGFALCEAIKSDEKLSHIPVVLLTARASEADKLEGLERGADDYLLKPFNRAELLARVENLIEIRRRLRRRFQQTVVAVEVSEADVTSEDADFLERATSIVEAHIEDGNFGVDWLASELEYSARHLQRRLKELTGLTPSGFIRSIRLERAAQLLEAGAGSVADVAAAVGFSDPRYFSRLFRQVFETTPSEYGAS